MILEIPTVLGKKRRDADLAFAEKLMEIQKQMVLPDGTVMKVGSRGWAYQLESMRLINKDEFDKIQKYMTNLRRKGILPVDFVEEDNERSFDGVEYPSEDSPIQHMKSYLEAAQECERWYKPDWWANEDYYIQLLVEKKDLLPLFSPTCRKYHIPIGNAKGWSSMYQRAAYAVRFEQAQEMDLQPVLLYLGDHDPDGLRISDFLRKNLEDLKNIRWSSGQKGYDPKNLIIDRFGLDYDFIDENNLTWIDNLITGSKKDLASPKHANHDMPYVQEYLKKYGARKCEANALITIPTQSITLLTEAIENYLGHDAIDRFSKIRKDVVDEVTKFRDDTGLSKAIAKAIEIIEEESATEAEV